MKLFCTVHSIAACTSTGIGLYCVLLENFHDALAALELRLRLGVEVGTELRERRQFAELRQVALDAAGHLFHRLDLRRRTDARHGQADGNRRAHALIKQIRFQINLAVGDGNHVGRECKPKRRPPAFR